MHVADLVVRGKDALGAVIEVFYARNPPSYAVYGTRERVAVQYADDAAAAAVQRKTFAQVNPLRGEINGLVDGWRIANGPFKSQLRQKAQRYDRRVGDALAAAFEDDVTGSIALLTQIKQDAVNERVAWARLEYVAVSLGLGLAVIVGLLVVLANLTWGPFVYADPALLHASITGALGAFFSIALGIKDRTVLPDFQRLANWTDAALRMVIGVIAATVLMALIKAGVVNINLGPQPTPSALEGLQIFLIGFVGGFSERLVPDLLAKIADKTEVVAAAPVPPVKEPPRPEVKPGVEAAAPEAPDEDPLPEEATHDSCACDVDLPDDETTPDDQLPPASGGVAAGGGAG